MSYDCVAVAGGTPNQPILRAFQILEGGLMDRRRARRLERLAIISELSGGDTVPEDIAGAVIERLGTFADGFLLDGGGLVIDYLPKGATRARRVIFAFNENGMWIAHQSDS